jgi:hypothetical protein
VHLHEPGAGDVAAILTGTLDVVRATRRWRVLHAPLGAVPNLAHAVFLHPAAPWFYLDPAQVQVAVVAQLRRRVLSAERPENGPLLAVAGELAEASERFRTLWTGLPVAYRPRAPYEVRHPDLGLLALDRSTRLLPDGSWCERLVPRPDRPAGPDADRLALLDLL